ncbi:MULTISPECIES: ribosomal protein L7/L12 [unclassified Streptomyces]|uniref:ribosomal protein L7/L12 n=1 Tax=unclassified Streptomyces TaxID=2593676 RepID=UPI002DDB929E|nr:MULTISPECIES: ribosomal protein L7/L12 [unclassified Streptomyces]WSA93313.1 ribosomal protein L7/L12 [Streptomyces sp. NBC_01795]WSB77701.1 ribosomal protein L7/L12 [Streptomyces sp. NBC_01775]WSS14050.1 ribosomal protein L7/L12 [Streptomyces sp. NBC_01186]WSS42869.1 ribosomal protein L7/L12 [Streptomyces sp. NBC_01187]
MEILIGCVVVGLLVFVAVHGIEARIVRTDRRLARVERKVDLILEHLGVQEHDPWLAEVAELARSGQKIQAIKRYRELTGEGLKEAKNVVDRMV